MEIIIEIIMNPKVHIINLTFLFLLLVILLIHLVSKNKTFMISLYELFSNLFLVFIAYHFGRHYDDPFFLNRLCLFYFC